MRRALFVAIALTALPASAGAPDDKAPKAAQLDDPCVDPNAAKCKAHALDHFTAAFAAQKSGKADRPLRISYFGDSLTADDQIAQMLRDKLGAIVGPGGPGFVHAAAPHPYCQHNAMSRWASGDWNVFGISTQIPADRLLGLGGSVEGSGSIVIAAKSAVRTVDLHYLAQPKGGSVAIVAGKTVIDTVATAGDAKKAEFKRVEVPEGTTRVELRATGHVRLFGAALEAQRGVVVDNLGVVNATAKAFATLDLPEHLKNELAHRGSDLVIVWLGTNEAEWLAPKGPGMVEHEQVFNDLLATVRGANPDGSCLVISPLDQMDWRDPQFQPRTSVPAMVEAQHRAATAHGCAFWNVYEWMGGKGASLTWFRKGLLVKDFQHPTTAGAKILADALFGGLVK